MLEWKSRLAALLTVAAVFAVAFGGLFLSGAFNYNW
jgi:hypothetical protein